jgi:hypothetical protein
MTKREWAFWTIIVFILFLAFDSLSQETVDTAKVNIRIDKPGNLQFKVITKIEFVFSPDSLPPDTIPPEPPDSLEPEIWEGLICKYYELPNIRTMPDFAQHTPKKKMIVREINRSMRERSENYAITFEGMVNVPVTGAYWFVVRGDDGFILYVDGQKIIDENRIQAPIQKDADIDLVEGWRDFRLEFFQGGGGAKLQLWWITPGSLVKLPIPAVNFGYLNIAYNPDHYQYILSWNPNTEDDLSGYKVLHDGSAGWSEVDCKSPFWEFDYLDTGIGLRYFQVFAYDFWQNFSMGSEIVSTWIR